MLFHLALPVDRVVDATVKSKPGDLFRIFVGGQLYAETVLGCWVINDPADSLHAVSSSAD